MISIERKRSYYLFLLFENSEYFFILTNKPDQSNSFHEGNSYHLCGVRERMYCVFDCWNNKQAVSLVASKRAGHKTYTALIKTTAYIFIRIHFTREILDNFPNKQRVVYFLNNFSLSLFIYVDENNYEHNIW